MARLEVERSVLVEELKRMTKVLGRGRSGEALLMFQNEKLVMRLGGVEFAIPAHGRWPGEARVASSWIRALAKIPPVQDPIVIQVSGGRLHMAGSSNVCTWQAQGACSIEMPLGLELLDLIRLGLSHPDEVLEKSGVARAVAEARADLEKRIMAAARQLAPMGVTATDIRLLVTGKFNADDRKSKIT
jgi:hypothetical protein